MCGLQSTDHVMYLYMYTWSTVQRNPLVFFILCRSSVTRERSPEYRSRERGRERERKRRVGSRWDDNGMRGEGGRRETTHRRGERSSVDCESKQGRERGAGGRRRRRQVSRSDSESDQSTERHFKRARSSSKDEHQRRERDQKSHRFDSRDLHNTQQGHSPSSRDDERSEGDKLLPSKWSRYRDSVDSASSSNEEGQGVSTMKTEERADVFGIDKLLP